MEFYQQQIWGEAARSIKRVLLNTLHRGRFQIKILSRIYPVCYESRSYHEEADFEVLAHLSQNQVCILDIGANEGATALMMASVMHPEGKIYGFEASEHSCRIMQENLRINNL